MTGKVFTELTDVAAVSDSILADWHALYQSTTSAQFYQHPAWVCACSKHLFQDSMKLGLGRINGELQIVMPLSSSKLANRLKHPQHDHMSVNDVLVHPTLLQSGSLLDVISAVLNQTSATWWEWHICNIPDSSSIMADLHQFPANWPTGNKTQRVQIDSNDSFWQLTPSRRSAWFDCTSEQIAPHGKLRRNLRRLRKQLSQEGDIRCELIDDPDALATAFEHFLSVESSGWKGGEAIAEKTELRGFYQSLLHSQQTGIAPRINLLWVGDTCASAQLALQTDNCLSLLKIGYNEQLAHFSPGSLLLEDVLEHAREHNIATVSLVTSPVWAERWHPKQKQVWHVTRYNNSSAGKTLAYLDRFKHVAKQQFKRAA